MVSPYYNKLSTAAYSTDTLYPATHGALAQGSTKGNYTDPETGIIFATQSSEMTEGGLTWGWALPEDAATVTATEYIGLVVRDTKTPNLNIKGSYAYHTAIGWRHQQRQWMDWYQPRRTNARGSSPSVLGRWN